MIEVMTTYLEMRSPNELRARPSTDESFGVREIIAPDWQLNRSLYLTVGEAWLWTDKRSWPAERWRDYVASDGLRTFVAEYAGATAGYYELQRERCDVEIAYFGFRLEFIGRGLGGPLLTSTMEEAWRWDASRVWVHTCSLDHPAALRNYEASGLRVYNSTTHRLSEDASLKKI